MNEMMMPAFSVIARQCLDVLATLSRLNVSLAALVTYLTDT